MILLVKLLLVKAVTLYSPGKRYTPWSLSAESQKTAQLAAQTPTRVSYSRAVWLYKEQLNRGIMEAVDKSKQAPGKVHYLPHHGVVRTDKMTTKLH